MSSASFSKVTYTGRAVQPLKRKGRPRLYGFDTEATPTGKCFMAAVSTGDGTRAVLTPDQILPYLFRRELRGRVGVAFNLRYDATAILQGLTLSELRILRATGSVKSGVYTFKVVADKAFTVRKGRESRTIYDLFSFFGTSLAAAAAELLGAEDKKRVIDVEKFTPRYIEKHWRFIADYCWQDSELVKLYSSAYVAYDACRRACDYQSVFEYWNTRKPVLSAAMASFHGGKFEVTSKGPYQMLYDIDINSAYPAVMATLPSINRGCDVVFSDRYVPDSSLALIKARVFVPPGFAHTIPVANGRGVQTYPCGDLGEVVLTLPEYLYLTSSGVATVDLLYGWWCVTDPAIEKPYKRFIEGLYKLKRTASSPLHRKVAKTLANALYGKQVQLIRKDGRYIAGSNWNPIYGAHVTGSVRVEMARLQNDYPSVVAVHTDSVLSTEPLPIPMSQELGRFKEEAAGSGYIVASGVYSITGGEGTKRVALRGFRSRLDIEGLARLGGSRDTVSIETKRPYTWREVAARGLNTDLLNRFHHETKEISCRQDSKRLWLDDWTSWQQVPQRQVESLPLPIEALRR